MVATAPTSSATANASSPTSTIMAQSGLIRVTSQFGSRSQYSVEWPGRLTK